MWNIHVLLLFVPLFISGQAEDVSPQVNVYADSDLTQRTDIPNEPQRTKFSISPVRGIPRPIPPPIYVGPLKPNTTLDPLTYQEKQEKLSIPNVQTNDYPTLQYHRSENLAPLPEHSPTYTNDHKISAQTESSTYSPSSYTLFSGPNYNSVHDIYTKTEPKINTPTPQLTQLKGEPQENHGPTNFTITLGHQSPLYATNCTCAEVLPAYNNPLQEATYATETILPSSESTTFPNVAVETTPTPLQISPETFLPQRPLYWAPRLPVHPSYEPTLSEPLPTYNIPSQETTLTSKPILPSSESTAFPNVAVETTPTPLQISSETFLPQRPLYWAPRLPVHPSHEPKLSEPLPTYSTPSQETTLTTKPILPSSGSTTFPNVAVETTLTPLQISPETFLPQRPLYWAPRLPVHPSHEQTLPEPLPTYNTPSQETTLTTKPILLSFESTTLPNVVTETTPTPLQKSSETFLSQRPLYWAPQIPIQSIHEQTLLQPLPKDKIPSQETTFTTKPILPSAESTTLPYVAAETTPTPLQKSPETFLPQQPLYWAPRLPVQPSHEPTLPQPLPTYNIPSHEETLITKPRLPSAESTTLPNVASETTPTPLQKSSETFLSQRPLYWAPQIPIQPIHEQTLLQPLPKDKIPSQETTFTTKPILPSAESTTLPNVAAETTPTPLQTSLETFLPQRPLYWAPRLPVQPSHEPTLPQPLPTYNTPSQEATLTTKPRLPSAESTTLPNVAAETTPTPLQKSPETFLPQRPLYWAQQIPIQSIHEPTLPEPLPTYNIPSQEATLTTKPRLLSAESTTLPNVAAKTTLTPLQKSPETFLPQRPLYWAPRLPVQPSHEPTLPQPLPTYNTSSLETTIVTKPILFSSESTTLPNLTTATTPILKQNSPETNLPQRPLYWTSRVPVQLNHETTLPPIPTKSPSPSTAVQPTVFVPKYNVRPIPSDLNVPISNASTPIPVINDNTKNLPQALPPQVPNALASELEPPPVEPAPLFNCVPTVQHSQIPTLTSTSQPVLETETESPKILLPYPNTEITPEFTITPKPSPKPVEAVLSLTPQKVPVYFTNTFEPRDPPPVFTRLPETSIVLTPPRVVSPASLPPNPSVYRPVIPNEYKALPQPSLLPTFGVVSTKNYNTFLNFQCDAENYYYRAENWCDAFIECKNFTPTAYLCPDGLYFNQKSLWPDSPCALPSQVQCKGKTLGHATGSSNQCVQKFGTFRIDGECSRYVVCEEGVATAMNCPPGLAFSSETSTCDWPENVPYCNPEVFKGFECPTPPLDEYGNPSHVITNHRYGASCTHYIACHQSQPRLLRCDPGRAFDDAAARCVDERYSTACSSP